MGVIIRPRTGIPAESPVADVEAAVNVTGSAAGSIKAASVKQDLDEGKTKDLDEGNTKDLKEGKTKDLEEGKSDPDLSFEKEAYISDAGLLETAKEFHARQKAAEVRKNHAPLVIGLTIGFLATIGSTVSGGAFNPLRATAPAFFTLNFTYVWIYWVGDCLGGVLAGLTHYYLFEDK
jgi:hypothetical protein